MLRYYASSIAGIHTDDKWLSIDWKKKLFVFLRPFHGTHTKAPMTFCLELFFLCHIRSSIWRRLIYKRQAINSPERQPKRIKMFSTVRADQLHKWCYNTDIWLFYCNINNTTAAMVLPFASGYGYATASMARLISNSKCVYIAILPLTQATESIYIVKRWCEHQCINHKVGIGHPNWSIRRQPYWKIRWLKHGSYNINTIGQWMLDNGNLLLQCITAKHIAIIY